MFSMYVNIFIYAKQVICKMSMYFIANVCARLQQPTIVVKICMFYLQNGSSCINVFTTMSWRIFLAPPSKVGNIIIPYFTLKKYI